MNTPPAGQKPGPNKRTYFRVPLRLKIDVQTGGATSRPAVLMDLSGGGCQIATRVSVETGQRLSYKFRRADGKPDLALRGLIKNKRYAESEHLYLYGITFEDLDGSDHDALLQEVTLLERRLIAHRPGISRAVDDAKNAPPRGARPRKKDQERAAYRVAWPFQVTFKVPGIPGTHRAQALDISAGGMRIATDLILRLEWSVELTFTMPAQVLDVLERNEALAVSALFGTRRAPAKNAVKQRPFAPISVRAGAVPGIRESRGRYVHGLQFKNADHLVRAEIIRFVHAAQLSKRRLAV